MLTGENRMAMYKGFVPLTHCPPQISRGPDRQDFEMGGRYETRDTWQGDRPTPGMARRKKWSSCWGLNSSGTAHSHCTDWAMPSTVSAKCRNLFPENNYTQWHIYIYMNLKTQDFVTCPENITSLRTYFEKRNLFIYTYIYIATLKNVQKTVALKMFLIWI